ncbi:hypothetical protein Cni_G18458 [Canna indica]|uniref:Uncharacterized protein n=1 Tax=Canna indica TaxID=4628 RepID=A0AAQ3QIR6_9LILI|nr:hypothetical protein Cni_G18458 [Canna indica]
MTELESGAPASAPRKKNPPLEEDFGKDFLSSWKSSKAENSLDFDVETVPRNGKSSFNFDKLDDFDLGGDFGKLPDFQMDMSDLDFSIPLKKTAKAIEKEPLLGKQDLKKDKFSFAFDFNELDKFDIDMKLSKTEMPSSKCMDENGSHCSDEVPKHDKQLDLKSNLVTNSCQLESHGNEIVPNKKRLSTSTSANILEPDGPCHDAVAGHGSAEELPQVNKNLISLDSVKGNTFKEQDGGVRPLNSSDSRNSSPVKSSSSRSCQPKSKTASEDCSTTLQTYEADQHEVTTEGNKSLGESETIHVNNEISQTLMTEVPQKHLDTSCFQFPISKMPGGTTASSNANSPLEVQDVPQRDDKNHLTNSMSLRIAKENNSIANTPPTRVTRTVNADKNLSPKLVDSSTKDKLPLKRKTLMESLADLKALDTFKHINSSPKGRVASSSTAKSFRPNLLSAESMIGPKNSPIKIQDSFQKDIKKHMPNLTTLRMTNVHNTISLMNKETNTVGEAKGKLSSKLAATFMTDKPVLLSPPLKIKTPKEQLTDLKVFNPIKRNDSSLERRFVQRGDNQDGSKNDAPVENPSFINGAPESENMDTEVPLLIENNGNIEKAESYSKELHDLCNMLKKKHEESKELLVRAIVNNNKLLMLNHPMIEEKVRALQMFAKSMQSKEYWKI